MQAVKALKADQTKKMFKLFKTGESANKGSPARSHIQLCKFEFKIK